MSVQGTPLTIIKQVKSQSFNNIPEAASRLFKARKNMGLSINELSTKTEVCRSTLRNVELGKENFGLIDLKKVSSVLQVSIAHLGAFDLLSETTLGEKIYKARLYYGHTQEEIASIISVSRGTISTWENNKIKPSSKYTYFINKYISILK